jgi:DNA-binding GntR family transcriptional regulator
MRSRTDSAERKIDSSAVETVFHSSDKPGSVSGRAPMREALREAILGRIIRGQLAPGSRINESRVAKDLDVSRTPLREALFCLEREGFVSSELARGFSVEPLSAREVRENYPIIWTLEGLALRASVPVIYSISEDLSKLNLAFTADDQPEHAIDCDAQWHELLLSGCPNRRLIQMLASLRATLRRYEYLYMRDPNLIAESVRQHLKIIEMLRAKDIEAAAQALVENWRFGMKVLLLQIGEP